MITEIFGNQLDDIESLALTMCLVMLGLTAVILVVARAFKRPARLPPPSKDCTRNFLQKDFK